MRQESDYTVDQAILAVWQDELKATRDATIKQQCLQQACELLPRFATHYQELKTLSRQVRRRLQRQWKRSLAGVALLLALGQAPALAATIDVGGTCALVDAITSANTDIATGGCTTGIGADTIVLPAGSTQTLTAINNNIYGPNGLPAIQSVITIAGNESTIMRASTAPAFRILFVGQTGKLTLERTTVSGGTATNINLFGAYQGGGVSNLGALTINNSTISGNSAINGGGISNGGNAQTANGIFYGVYGSLTVNNSIISGNNAETAGGVSNFGTLTINNSTISGNISQHGGGGIGNIGTLTLTNSSVSGNSTNAFGAGGGIVNSGNAALANSTIFVTILYPMRLFRS